jgi:DNA-binding transcriptional MerR regulator
MLSISKPTLYKRLEQFDSFLEEHLRTGDHNQTLITETGRKILERIEQLRNEKFSIKQIESKLREELNMPPPSGSNAGSLDSQLLYKTVGILERENEFLKERVKKLEESVESKDREITRLHEIIQNRLPALPPGSDNAQKPSRWTRFKQLLIGA